MRSNLIRTLGLAAVLAAPLAGAQTAQISGSLGNFDISNDTGGEVCGFEVQVEGATAAEYGGGFSAQRYGAPVLVEYPGGIYIRWQANVGNDNQCSTHTIPHTPGVAFGGTCYIWNGQQAYDNAGCEHFGVYLGSATPHPIWARWLTPSAATPGTLVAVNPPEAIAFPYYYIVAPVRAGDPPQVAVEIQAPEPAETPEVYGDAQWMRVFVTQYPTEVTLDQLVTDNAIVPQDATKLESDWQIIQDEPASGGTGNRKRRRNQGNLLPTTRTVVRRIEMHEFTGAYDPVTHEAICADGLCNVPAADEIGDQISAQMTAVNVQSDSVTVTKTGNGQVDSLDKRISCGNKCVAPYDRGTLVQLTAKAGSGSTFTGWTGGCTGAQLTCTVNATGHADVGATFAIVAAGGGGGGGGGGGCGGGGGGAAGGGTGSLLSVKAQGGKGLITANAGRINCGKTCSGTVAAGTVVTVNAVADPGFIFSSWSGACTGAVASCTFTMNAASSVQANFTK